LYTTENTVGENNPFFGKKHTDETKIKLSEQAINKTFEERFGIQRAMEIKEKISKAGTGRKHIPTEYQIKIFELANEKRKKRIRVINTETGLDHIFESIREAAKELKISRSPLRDSLKKIYIKSKWLVTYVD
jgi:group I intron endonuclease